MVNSILSGIIVRYIGMFNKSLHRTSRTIILTLLTVAYFGLQILQQSLIKSHLVAVNGILMSVQFVICFLLVITDYKTGSILSHICLSVSLILLLYIFFVLGKVDPLPGFCSTIIYFITITILGLQFKKRDKENISDYLTGLLNERGLNRTIQNLIEEKTPFFIFGIHIQNYSVITANYGHALGEILLKKIAKDISDVVKETGSAALIKGTEFYVVMDGNSYATGLAYGILNKLAEKKVISYRDNETEIYLNIYTGFAKFPDDAATPDQLLKCADIAVYHSQRTKTKISNFEPQMEESINRHIRIEKLIKSSLQHDYFYLVYQPQFSLNGKKLRGFETLLRMNAPHGDGVGPADFIPIAEKSDLILKIDDYVLLRAMTEFKDIVTSQNKELVISVNVSARNIGSPDFTSKILRLLSKTHFPAENLEIEITEYCLIQSIDIAIENIRELRKIGVMIALDDFGTGYTSLSYLAKMPVNLLKIDKSLIDDIETNSKILEFVNTVISLGHLMNCEVISEGVENESQLALLKEKSCDLIQGYVWGKPLTYKNACTLALENIDQGYLPFDRD